MNKPRTAARAARLPAGPSRAEGPCGRGRYPLPRAARACQGPRRGPCQARREAAPSLPPPRAPARAWCGHGRVCVVGAAADARRLDRGRRPRARAGGGHPPAHAAARGLTGAGPAGPDTAGVDRIASRRIAKRVRVRAIRRGAITPGCNRREICDNLETTVTYQFSAATAVR